jgi:heme/copper-type cytochrome/quinol oxidase subunit 2
VAPAVVVVRERDYSEWIKKKKRESTMKREKAKVYYDEGR